MISTSRSEAGTVAQRCFQIGSMEQTMAHEKQTKMAELKSGKLVTLEELIVSTLAQGDALAKLLIEKGIITQQEFLQRRGQCIKNC